jgi:LysR family transcriptional regulator, glycine cleavage system transcriptional activator
MSDPLATTPLSAIRIFEAAARLRSFTRAAEELGVTQAAVSWQVKALEQRLGQALFRRLPREVALTAAGERLAKAARDALGLLRNAISDLTDQADGVLAITTMESLAIQWLAPRIGAFQLAHPNIAVRLDTSTLTHNLIQDGFDVAIRSGTGDWPGLTSHFLFPSELTPLCTPQVRAELGGLVQPSQLLSAARLGTDADWAAWFAAAGLPKPPIQAGGQLIADMQVIAITSALAGQGVALGSPLLFAGELARGALVQPFALTIAQTAGYWLACVKERYRAAKIAAFRDWLLAAVAGERAAA